jgi:serine/threonine protein phosphatase PrpC
MGHFTLSHKGLVRSNNEDYADSFDISWCDLNGNELAITALLLADGMGGAAAGEFASNLAVTTIKRKLLADVFAHDAAYFIENDRTEYLDNYIQLANQAIFEKASNTPAMKGMGTTTVAGIIYRNSLALTHVGDSRAYKFVDNKLSKLTLDHSLVQEFINAGQLKEEDAFEHPQRNIITRALGMNPAVKVDRKNLPLNYGDIIMFCSDGLCGFAKDHEIEEELIRVKGKNQEANLKSLSESMIALACKNGGGDNISVCFYQHLTKF